MSTAQQSSAQPRRVIKRYSNRKLYDTRDSRYVTLQQIGEMVRNGEDVQIIDNKTKEDKTEVTLALILSEDLKNKPSRVSVATLRELIQERSGRIMNQLRDGPFGRFVPRDGEEVPGEGEASSAPAPDSVASGVSPAPQPVEQPAAEGEDKGPGPTAAVQQRFTEWMDNSRQSLEQLQARVDDSLRSLPGVALVHEVHELRATVVALQKRVAELEKAAGLPVVESAEAGDSAEPAAAASEE